MTIDQVLSIIRGVSINEVIIELKTDPDMVKIGNPYFGKIRKYQKIKCKTFFNYEEEVNKQRVIEGKMANFISKEITQGDIIQQNPIIIRTKNGEFLLQLILLEQIERRFYFNEGEISETFISKYINKKTKRNNSQGLDFPIMIINVNVKNIIKIV